MRRGRREAAADRSILGHEPTDNFTCRRGGKVDCPVRGSRIKWQTCAGDEDLPRENADVVLELSQQAIERNDVSAAIPQTPLTAAKPSHSQAATLFEAAFFDHIALVDWSFCRLIAH